MKISKSLFKNLSRCMNFASLYDMYTFRNAHHIKELFGENIKDYKNDVSNLEDGLFDEQNEKALEIFSEMYDDDTGDDLTVTVSAQMEALMPYFTKLEIVAAEVIKKRFPGNLTYGENITFQKKFSYTENEHEYYCYLDIYDECDDGVIRIFEVKATTSKKFIRLGKVNKELKEQEENSCVKYPDILKYNSIFKKAPDGIYRLQEEIDQQFIPDKDYKTYRNKLFDRFGSTNTGKYVYDIAVERYIVENSLKQQKTPDVINNMEFYLTILNGDYELETNLPLDTIDYPKDKNGNDLIVFFDMTNITKEYYPLIDDEKRYINSCIERRTIEKSCVSKNCEYKKISECKFKRVCYKKSLVDGSVSEFIDRTFKPIGTDETWTLYDLINAGYYKMLDVPSDFIVKKKHQIQYNCMLNNEEYLDLELFEKAIKEIKYPIYHLDFETFNCPIPRYHGEHPYSQSVFQFSLHVEQERGICDKQINHLEYLAPDHEDHRREICEKLIEYIDLSKGGTVLVYNESFEKSRLKELAIIYPDLKDGLLKIRESVFDLLFVLKGNKKLFMKLLPDDLSKKEKEERCAIFNYYNNGLHGSFSIKKVLPLFTNLSYKDLTVHNGTEAILTYSKLPTLTDSEYERLYLALRQYCQQDTWAMVEILWGLIKKVQESK